LRYFCVSKFRVFFEPISDRLAPHGAELYVSIRKKICGLSPLRQLGGMYCIRQMFFLVTSLFVGIESISGSGFFPVQPGILRAVPVFYGTGFSRWSRKICERFRAVNPVFSGCPVPVEPENRVPILGIDQYRRLRNNQKICSPILEEIVLITFLQEFLSGCRVLWMTK